MVDPTAILVDNLTDALAQITTYLALGLASAISVFALDRSPLKDKDDTVTLPGGFVPMDVGTATAVLLGICLAAGLLAAIAAEGAIKIAASLSGEPKILGAVCTRSGIATSLIGFRIIGAVLPLAFLAPVFWRMSGRLREVVPNEKGLFWTPMAGFAVPFGALALSLAKLPCR